MDKKTMWSLAAKNGLLLSLITIVIVSLSTFITLPSTVGIILTVIKFVAIISVLYYFMKQYSDDLEFVSYGDSFKYGLTICFLSSIVCTLFTTFMGLVIQPELLETQLEASMLLFESMGMENTLDYDDMRGMMTTALPIGAFIGYMIYGLIYSSIIANFTKKDEVFPTSQEN